jgi:hypothetical protein
MIAAFQLRFGERVWQQVPQRKGAYLVRAHVFGYFAALVAVVARTAARGAYPESAPLPPPPRAASGVSEVHGAPGGAPRVAPRLALQQTTNAPTVTSGTWTPLSDQPYSHTPVFFPNGVYLLTDGSVLAQNADLQDISWWKLTPDQNGSYINGSWTQVASPPACPNNFPGASADTIYSPLYYASAVLPDGRFIMVGGEYNYNYDYVYNNGSREVFTSQGAIYDPVANTWTCIAPPPGWTNIGDAQSVVLADGTFMLAHFTDNQVATLDTSTNPPTFNPPFTTPGKSYQYDEEGWTLLPDGTVLTTENWDPSDNAQTPALKYDPNTGTWSSAGIAPDPLTLLTEGTTQYYEIGPAILRPDGTVFASGATGFNDVYDFNTSTWSSGPSFPTVQVNYGAGSCSLSNATEQLKAADAPAALLPDGNVLIAAAPVDSQAACQWVPPTEFFEFDGTNLTQVASSTYSSTSVSFVGRLLVLPTGQVLYTNTYNYVEIYTPAGTPNPAWAPTITSFPPSVTAGAANYQLTGTQFNGLSQAVAYGDDYQAATNYPLVRIRNSITGHVVYARTHDHSTMAVATGSATVSTEFDVPVGIEAGTSALVVVANGIPSQPVDLYVVSNVMPPTPTPSPTPTTFATCASTPLASCGQASKGAVKLQGSADLAKQKLQWKWSNGSVAAGEFGDPVTGSTSYALCIYDDGGFVARRAITGGVCDSDGCWSTNSKGLLTYKNKFGNDDGITKVALKPDATGKAKIQVKGKGGSSPLPLPLTGASNVTVQLVKDSASGPECWQTVFPAPATKTGSLVFQDQAP